ncbi:MAG: Fpg/Nei family DNA glycosylase [Planctomycetota bacterium]|nr:MAG: Fpg/Nei family DNA glycosylase [Planctomycetota bacterium]
MPELPEVESMRRGIAAVSGARILSAQFPMEGCRPLSITPSPSILARQLTGAMLGGIERFGKRVAIGITSQQLPEPRWLLIEPRMTGLLLVADPPSTKHVRMQLELGLCSIPRLLFWDQRGLGTIRLLDAAGLERACGPAKLGPDGLVINAPDLQLRLGGSRRAVKVALLDQRAVAGIGNIYASEILHRAGIHPQTPCQDLRTEAWQGIATAARRVLAAAVRLEGSSIGDELYRTADNRKGGYQRFHRVYGLHGSQCRCGAEIRRIVQAQRSTFFCPSCQPSRSPRRISSRGRLESRDKKA